IWFFLFTAGCATRPAKSAENTPAATQQQQSHASETFDARAYGAKGDGKAIDTAAINKAIDAANAAGGGTVHFPAGTYLSVSIHLKSNVSLYLDHGATIRAAKPASAEGAAYDAPEPNQFDAFQDYGHSHWNSSLIW